MNRPGFMRLVRSRMVDLLGDDWVEVDLGALSTWVGGAETVEEACEDLLECSLQAKDVK